MKVEKQNFYDLQKALQKSIIKDFERNGFNPAYLTGEYSQEEVNAEVVIDEYGTLYDIQIFDPFHIVDSDIYTNADGWSDWLYGYMDPAGNDIDEIFADYDGVPQE